MDPRRLDIRALAFDVFGTVVDWRGSLIRETESVAAFSGIRIDWTLLVDEWRAAYQPSLERVRRGERPWTKLDVLHRESLDRLLEQLGGAALDAESRDELNRAWHRLDPWPDAVAGLTRLRRRFVLATLSNGNMAILVNMAKRARLPWDCILSAELVQRYKPQPEVYLSAAEFLGLAPRQVMMVAAHNSDLVAAASCGLRTAFVARPGEYGPRQEHDLAPEHEFDVVARDFVHLAELLGA